MAKLTLQDVIAKINQKSPGSLVTGAEVKESDPGRISSGILTLDRLTGGGFPRGLITHVFGPPSSGKSSTTIQTIGYNQRKDPNFFAVVVNIEGYWSAKSMYYVQKFGVDMDRLYIINKPSVEEAMGIFETVVESNTVDLALVDSFAGLISNEELEKALTDKQKIAEQARFARRILNRIIAKSQTRYDKETKKNVANKTAIILLNQMTNTLNQYDNVNTSGGESPHYYASIEIETRTGAKDDNIYYSSDKKILEEMGNTIAAQDLANKCFIGQGINYIIRKNRTAPTKSRKDKADFYNTLVQVPSDTGFTGFGFDRVTDIVNMGIKYDIISVDGSWYKIGDQKCQGRDNFVAMLRKEVDLLDELEQVIVKEITNEFER